MKKYAYVLVLSALILLPAHLALADEATSTPDIIDTGTASSTDETASSTPPADSTGSPQVASSTPLVIDGHVDVPAACTVIDTDGGSHDYLAASSTAYIGICALAAAKDDGLISDFQATSFSFGLFITSVGGIDADPSSQYWALFLNSDFPSVGLTDLPIAMDDTIELQLHDFSDNATGDHLTLHIDSLISTSSATTTPEATSTPPEGDSSSTTSTSSSGGGGGGGGGISHSQLNVATALSFLSSKQNTDGSFDSSGSLLTDWAAIAFASTNDSQEKTKLRNYLLVASPLFTSVTDYERHAMALEALGINPYSGTATNFITPIVAAFDGTQIGDPHLDNDDIFAIFPLLHAGYSVNDPIIQKTVQFILSAQTPGGSWDNSVDMTAAAVQALSQVASLPDVGTALSKAESYLHTKQETNGGFGNSFSTSWMLQAIAALHESPSNWAPAIYTPQDYLALLQQPDGGVDTTSTAEAMRIWATSYAIPAALNKTWDSLLTTFSKPTGSTTTGSSANAASISGQMATKSVGTTTVTTANIESDATEYDSATTTTPLVLGAATSTLTVAAAPTSTPVIHPKPKAVIAKKLTPKIAVVPTTQATSSIATNSQPQTAAAGTTQAAQNIFVRIWNFLKHLFSL